MVITLPVELTCTGELKPGLEEFGNGLVQQRALGVARVVGFSLGVRWPARFQMGVRWAGDGGHGEVPAWAGCLAILWLYPALFIALLAAGSLVTLELIASYAHSASAGCPRSELPCIQSDGLSFWGLTESHARTLSCTRKNFIGKSCPVFLLPCRTALT